MNIKLGFKWEIFKVLSKVSGFIFGINLYAYLMEKGFENLAFLVAMLTLILYVYELVSRKVNE